MDVKSKVYIKLDDKHRVTAVEGGYSTANITDISEWIFIDEGVGDRYNLCQSHYFDGGLYDCQGRYRWKYEDGKCVLRSEAEIDADVVDTGEVVPSMESRVSELETCVDYLISGETGGAI